MAGSRGDRPEDLTWIGNWWLGYIVCSAVLVLLSVPMATFPTRLPRRGEGRGGAGAQPIRTQGFVEQVKGTACDVTVCHDAHIVFCPIVNIVMSDDRVKVLPVYGLLPFAMMPILSSIQFVNIVMTE